MSLLKRYTRRSHKGADQNIKKTYTSFSQWCGLRPSVLEQDRSQTKKSVLDLVFHAVILVLVLVLQVWCCVVKQSCYARRHNDLGGHSNFSSTIYRFSIDNDMLTGALGVGRLSCEEEILWMLSKRIPLTYMYCKHSKCNIIRNLQSWS